MVAHEEVGRAWSVWKLLCERLPEAEAHFTPEVTITQLIACYEALLSGHVK